MFSMLAASVTLGLANASVALAGGGASARLAVCNDTTSPFQIAADLGAFRLVLARGCTYFEVSPGEHVLTPKGAAFARPAWQVEVPEDGAWVRFARHGSGVDLIGAVGLLGAETGSSDARILAERSVHVRGDAETPLSSLSVC